MQSRDLEFNPPERTRCGLDIYADQAACPEVVEEPHRLERSRIVAGREVL
jgi:hypothetical protein